MLTNSDSIQSSSPAFNSPLHPIHRQRPEKLKPSFLPIQLPPATLRPLAFRIFTKKHDLTLSSSALNTLADFIGTHCGSTWREESSAEKILEEVAKAWKKNGGGVIVLGEGNSLIDTLHRLESSISQGKLVQQNGSNSQGSSTSGLAVAEQNNNSGSLVFRNSPRGSDRWHNLDNSNASASDPRKTATGEIPSGDPRSWIKVIGAFEQPRLSYNWSQKHLETLITPPSLLPSPPQSTNFFRHRYNLIHQRLLRNEAFENPTVSYSRISSLQRSASNITSAQQAYKLTPVANLLGRSGSSHLLLGLLTISPTGTLTLCDMTGSIALDIQHARPIPEDGAWFTPGMIVLVDGVYDDEGCIGGATVGTDAGIGGTIGGKFIALSLGGPPSERRDITLGIDNDGDRNIHTGAGFGWIDFLGVGSERAQGSRLTKTEQAIFKQDGPHALGPGRSRIIIIGETDLSNANTFSALKLILGKYAAEESNQSPMAFVLTGNFVSHAAMAGSENNGSIEYKECFNSLASTLSEYPTIIQKATFVFVPGDNDPWASAFSAGAATILPRKGIPKIFTSRVQRVFTSANAQADKVTKEKADGEAIWTTNPARLTLFGPVQEVVFFRDDITGRLNRNAVKFSPSNNDSIQNPDVSNDEDQGHALSNSQGGMRPHQMSADELTETTGAYLLAQRNIDSLSPDMSTARKLVKTLLDQGYLSPFPVSVRPVLWDFASALQLYPLPTALVLMDPEAPSFALTYEGCHVMNPGRLLVHGRRGMAQWMEYDARTRRGKVKQANF